MYEEIIKHAVESKEKAYAPYSKFHVGASLITEGGKIYNGANIENSSYSLTICAERNAAFRAVFEGERKFKAIAIAGNTKEFLPPCGACRQVLMDLCGKELDVVMINKDNETKTVKLKELLPFSFGDDYLV